MMDIFTSPLGQPPPLQLSDERIWLRPPHENDWQNWANLRHDSREFLAPWEPTWPVDALTKSAWHRRLRRQYEEWRQDLGYHLLFFKVSDHSLMGGLSLTNVRRGVAQMGTLGYWIGQPYARQGYTSAAVKLLCNHAFGALSLHRLEAGCLPRNMPSRKLLGRCGFKEEGLARNYLRINGKWEDHVMFGLVREEWGA
jgi:[ribosomal protein S5]-alanine N-acetyltransferase